MIVRGRVDHKEAGETKLVVQEVEVFEPSHEEVEQAKAEAACFASARPSGSRLSVPGGVADSFLDELKDVVHHHPGDHELMLHVGERRLLLGPDFRVSATNQCRAELAALMGVEIAAA